MSKSKKILYGFTFGLLIFLIICTIVSIFVADAMLPNVEVVNPVGMELMGTHHDRVIPYSAIIHGEHGRTFVFVVRANRGLFGPEYVVRLLEVQLVDSNEIYAAISGWNVMIFDEVVVYSSRVISSGEVVRVTNR